MKKHWMLLATLFSVAVSAQVSVAVRGNMLYKADQATWSSIKTSTNQVITDKGKNNVGYNVGLSFKIDTPASIFVMPEIYYTTFKNTFTDPNTNTTLEAKSNRVDVPVLVGMNVISKSFGLFVGPVASYNLSTENQYNDFVENATKKFTLGYQFGANLKISKIHVSARYEGAFTQDQRQFIANYTGGTQNVIRYDSRPGLILFGLGYQF